MQTADSIMVYCKNIHRNIFILVYLVWFYTDKVGWFFGVCYDH